MTTLEQCLNLFPQTQCTECGYSGCQPYAQALLDGTEQNPSKCLPGGENVAKKVADLLQLPQQPITRIPQEWTAYIHVDQCIGCHLCVKICPVDAIIGALNFEHQIIEQDCTGCQLCLPVCPTACISIEPRHQPLPTPQKNLENIERKHKTYTILKENKMKGHKASLAQLIKKNTEDKNL
jgi:electron transport complex protein RnfB